MITIYSIFCYFIQIGDLKMKKFDKNAYNTAYNKTNYKQLKIEVKHDIYYIIDSYCKNNNISKATFITRACKYIIDNEIDISDIKL